MKNRRHQLKRHTSVRSKIITTVVIIILCISATNILTMVNYSRTNSEYKKVLQDLSNTYMVIDTVKGITPDLSKLLLKEIDQVDPIIGKVNSAKSIIETFLVSSQIKEETVALKSVKRLIETIGASVLKAHEFAQAGDLTNAITERDNVKRVSVFITEQMQEYVLLQLNAIKSLEKQINSDFLMLIKLSIGILLLSLFCSILIIVKISHNISKPLLKVRDCANAVADGDFTIPPIQLKTRDEIKDLATAFNVMVDNTRKSIGTIKEVSGQVHTSSGQLSIISEENSRAGEDISASVNNVVIGIKRQKDTFNEIRNDIKITYDIASQIDINDQKIVENANRSVLLAQDGIDYILNLVETMKGINGKINLSVSTTQELNLRSKDMNVILSSMADIASQTNLLSLNASIEAARAGEYGAGFSVVAQEIRKLAKDSEEFAGKIGEIINSFDQTLKEITVQMQENGQQIDAGCEIANKSYQYFENIKDSNVVVDRDIQANAKELQELIKKMKTVDQSVEQNHDIIERNASEIETISAALEQQLASLEELTSEAALLNNLAMEIDAVGKKFKI